MSSPSPGEPAAASSQVVIFSIAYSSVSILLAVSAIILCVNAVKFSRLRPRKGQLSLRMHVYAAGTVFHTFGAMELLSYTGDQHDSLWRSIMCVCYTFNLISISHVIIYITHACLKSLGHFLHPIPFMFARTILPVLVIHSCMIGIGLLMLMVAVMYGSLSAVGIFSLIFCITNLTIVLFFLCTLMAVFLKGLRLHSALFAHRVKTVKGLIVASVVYCCCEFLTLPGIAIDGLAKQGRADGLHLYTTPRYYTSLKDGLIDERRIVLACCNTIAFIALYIHFWQPVVFCGRQPPPQILENISRESTATGDFKSGFEPSNAVQKSPGPRTRSSPARSCKKGSGSTTSTASSVRLNNAASPNARSRGASSGSDHTPRVRTGGGNSTSTSTKRVGHSAGPSGSVSVKEKEGSAKEDSSERLGVVDKEKVEERESEKERAENGGAGERDLRFHAVLPNIPSSPKVSSREDQSQSHSRSQHRCAVPLDDEEGQAVIASPAHQCARVSAVSAHSSNKLDALVLNSSTSEGANRDAGQGPVQHEGQLPEAPPLSIADLPESPPDVSISVAPQPPAPGQEHNCHE